MGEMQVNFDSGVSLYCLVRNAVGQVWNTSGSVFETYVAANYANYVVALVEETGSGGFYKGTFPTAILAGTYGITCRQALGGSGNEAAGDPFVGIENFPWNGTARFDFSSLATASLLNAGFPQRPARGFMVQNIPLYFKSSVDHVTPMASGVVSGQIIRDSGSWGPLQSGAFVNQGQGFYNLMALTSGDLLANTVKLLFTCQDSLSAVQADPIAIGLLLNRSSGQ